MFRSLKNPFTSLLLCSWVMGGVRLLGQDPGVSGMPKGLSQVTIRTIDLRVTQEALAWCYEISNQSSRDIWICDGVVKGDYNFDVDMVDEEQTLRIRRRVDIPQELHMDFLPWGGYTRLHAGEKRTESLLLQLPVRGRSNFTRVLNPTATAYSSRVVIEIGFYVGNLYDLLIRACEDADARKPVQALPGVTDTPEILHFVRWNEWSPSREDRIFYNSRTVRLENARVLRLTADNLRIAYRRPTSLLDSRPCPPDLRKCARAEIRFEPSILDYCFPYSRQQRLMNSTEQQWLRSQSAVVMEDPNSLSVLARQVDFGRPGGMVVERKARMVCYRDGQPPESFILYNGEELETADGQRFHYFLRPLDLGSLIPQIQPFELRVHCARNLEDLWHRFRQYPKSLADGLPRSSHHDRATYPSPGRWCDDLARAYWGTGYGEDRYVCPGVPKTRCSYAMNPDCQYDSPAGTVLLFETDAGWNQHGGPELFAFGNHDPRGGLVLLNDGTVKFIRTEEEVQQLRWN